jgi:hypothetical protein
MQQQTVYNAPSTLAKLTASQQRLIQSMTAMGVPGPFVTTLAEPHTVSNRFVLPDPITGQVESGLPTTPTVMGMSSVRNVVVWCPSKTLVPANTQSGTVTTIIHGVPDATFGFDVDVTLARPTIGNVPEVATAFNVRMIVFSPTLEANNTTSSVVYTGTVKIPASSPGEALFCEPIIWDALTSANAYSGVDNVMRPMFAASTSGYVPPMHAVSFEFSPSTGSAIPVQNIVFAALRLTFRI